MIDIFLKEDINKLVKNKSIVFLGDSNIRALYKDFLCLLTQSKLIKDDTLRKKMEPSVFGDKLKFHGQRNNGRDYREERKYIFKNTDVSFYFLTRVYDKYVRDVLDLITSKRKPDVLVINCCLWDVTRWGATGVEDYKINLQTLLKRLKLLIPDCLVIWITAPPISGELRGGFLVQEIEFLKYSLRFHVMEANHFARKVVVENGFDLLDSHYHLKMQIHRRAPDGIHWLPPAVRYITNLLLTHISLAWNVPLPRRYESNNLNLLEDEVSEVVPVKVKEEVQKENQDFPKPPPKRKKPNSSRGSSYHAKADYKKRLQRIRKWQPENSNQYFSPRPSAASSRYNSPANNSYQHDSGYFPSPAEASLSNEFLRSNRRNITFGSPARVQSHGFASPIGSPFANRRMLRESFSHGGQTYQSYNVHDIPLPSEAYPSYHDENVPLPFEAYESCVQNSPFPYHLQKRRSMLPEPYSFPYASQGQTLRPRIDFASDADNFLAF